MTINNLVLPRPGTNNTSNSPQVIKAPSEEAFTSIFGNLLPKASYLETPIGRAAYYSLPPTTSTSTKTPRVLFIHGVQTPALGLQPLYKAISARFPSAHYVLVDLWGHGLSDTPVVPHTPELFHTLLLALMEELGWADAHVVGYSFGASTTASFVARYPSRVSSMVLVAPAGLVRSAQFDEVERGYLVGGEGVDEDAAREWGIGWLEGGELVVPADWEERVGRGEVVAEAVREWEGRVHEGHVGSVVGILRDGGVFDNHAAFEQAAETKTPSLCILGELDDLCSVQELKDVGLSNVAVVSGVGHGVVRQSVPEVVDLMDALYRAALLSSGFDV
ncbi:valacyclovir hydrolase [Penicillium verhagenii]|uniref:valacyclovir hydrolase n=1 Tax=Penicillium verhagenii TaxID=1562060 RepID=UPI0025452129|nr:valacyclovir hydrolase [Penicillium verhagenii]KAJ5948131.1 valacyclovir hydrolase [Penicillium verhagenii]